MLYQAAPGEDCSEQLERGRIVQFARCPIDLPTAAEQEFLRNELVHVDAGAYGATHGDRILRFFVNLNPSSDRIWISKGTFADLLGRHGAEAGIASGDLQAALPERAYRGLLRAAGRAFPMLRV